MIMEFNKDFSLEAWFIDGMITRVEAVKRKAGSVVAASALAAAAVFSSPSVPLPTNPSASTLPLRVDVEFAQAKAQLRADELARSIDSQLEQLGSRSESAFGTDRVLRARKALASRATRKATAVG
jgi:hypothetical protein